MGLGWVRFPAARYLADSREKSMQGENMGNNELATKVPEWVVNVSGATGYEEVTQDDIPRLMLKIAQGSSEIMKDPAKRIAGLELGSFYCSATGKNYGPTPRIVMLHAPIVSYRLKSSYTLDAETIKTIDAEEWERRYRGGSEWAEKGDGKKYLRTAEGYAVSETRTVPVIMADDIGAGVVLFPITGMGLKISRAWTAKAMAKNFPGRPGESLPAWLTLWELSTVYVPADGGYYTLTMPKDLGFIPDAIQDVCAEAFSRIQRMKKSFKASDLSSEEPGAKAPPESDEIPF